MVTDGIVKIHVHISFHWQGLNPNPLVNTCLQSLQLNSSRASLSELNVTVHVLFSASTRPTGQLDGREAEVTWRVSDWLTIVGCWDCLHVLDPDRLSAARWVAVLLVCSLCVALAVFVSWTRSVYPNWGRNDAAAVCDGGALPLDWMDRDDRNEEISR